MSISKHTQESSHFLVKCVDLWQRTSLLIQEWTHNGEKLYACEVGAFSFCMEIKFTRTYVSTLWRKAIFLLSMGVFFWPYSRICRHTLGRSHIVKCVGLLFMDIKLHVTRNYILVKFMILHFYINFLQMHTGGVCVCVCDGSKLLSISVFLFRLFLFFSMQFRLAVRCLNI